MKKRTIIVYGMLGILLLAGISVAIKHTPPDILSHIIFAIIFLSVSALIALGLLYPKISWPIVASLLSLAVVILIIKGIYTEMDTFLTSRGLWPLALGSIGFLIFLWVLWVKRYDSTVARVILTILGVLVLLAVLYGLYLLFSLKLIAFLILIALVVLIYLIIKN